MFKVVLRVIIGLLAGVGIWTVGSKLVNKYYEGLNEDDSDFDVDEFDDDEDACGCDECAAEDDKKETEEKKDEE